MRSPLRILYLEDDPRDAELYSAASKNLGIVWEEDILRKYLAAPQSVVPETKMTFIGLKDPQQVEDIIAYLKEATKTE